MAITTWTTFQINLPVDLKKKKNEVVCNYQFFEGFEIIWKMYEEQTESAHKQRNCLLSENIIFELAQDGYDFNFICDLFV